MKNMQTNRVLSLVNLINNYNSLKTRTLSNQQKFQFLDLAIK